jgi:hypothetical protein
MIAAYGPIAGRGRGGYAFRGGGTALASACRAVRRCTRCRTASSRIDTPPARQSRLICSNSSTRDLAIPDLRADSNDAKDQIQGGATIPRRHAGPPAQARSPPRRGRNSRRQKAKPGPVQVITLKYPRSRRELDPDRYQELFALTASGRVHHAWNCLPTMAVPTGSRGPSGPPGTRCPDQLGRGFATKRLIMVIFWEDG